MGAPHWTVIGLLAVASPAWAASAQAWSDEGGRLIDLSIEQLVEVEITSVAKKSQRLSEAPAAIFVISSDDIRRAGVTSIPEALRLAPGIEVARIDNNKWAITARGFNGRFANKLLVLMDGRSIYSPLFSGVLWDMQDTLLEDIDRIEVIRGPGAALWGANAVNGVINIITRNARETQGSLLSATAGKEERGQVGFRHGGTTEQGTAWRVYGKAFDRDAMVDSSGSATHDGWRARRTGFRSDGKLGAGNNFTLQGDVFKNSEGETVTRPILAPPYSLVENTSLENSGLNLLGRLNRITDTGEMTLQAYYDGTRLKSVVLDEQRDTVDLDFQQRHLLDQKHDLVWGLGYRLTRGRTDAGVAAMVPSRRTDRLFSAFLQDEIAISDTVRITLGSKLEHNDYSGWEFQPSVRALWKMAAGQTAWASISRAVRTPSWADTQVRIDAAAFPSSTPGVPVLVQTRGSERIEPERLMAYELGWRLSPNPAWALDLAAFVNDYDRLTTEEMGPSFFLLAPVPHFVQTTVTGNELKGRTYGFETVLEARPTERWRLVATYSNLHFDLQARSGSTDIGTLSRLEGSSPASQFSLRSEWSIDSRTEFDAWIRYVGKLPGIDVGSYTSLNLRLAWRPQPDTEIALVGQNLFDPHHLEFRPEFISSQPTEVQRAIYATLRFRF